LPKPISPNRLPILSRLLRQRFIPPTESSPPAGRLLCKDHVHS
jgi:hypothetical protein